MSTKRTSLAFALIFGALNLAPGSAHAGAWAQEDRGVYIKWSGVWDAAQEQFKESGDTFQLLSEDDRGTYRGLSTSLYAELGLLPSLTAIASIHYKSMTLDSQAIRATTRGFGDLGLGLKYQFWDDGFVASVMASGHLPTGYTAEHPDPRTPTLGLGVPAAELTLLAGRSFYPAPLYISAQAGLRVRGARSGAPNFPPALPALLEIGWGPKPWVWLRGVTALHWGFGNPDAIDTINFTPATRRAVQLGPSLIFTVFERYQLNLDYLYTPWGLNSLRSHQIMAGLALDTVL